MYKLQRNRYIRRAYSLVSRSLYFPPLVVLAAIIVITIWPWQNARQSLKANVNQAVEEKVGDTQNRLRERFANFNASLQSGVALLQTNPDLTKEQWRTYFSSAERTVNSPGIQGTGYSRVFRSEQVDQVTAMMAAQGVPDFSVHPLQPESPLSSAVLYLYPETDNNKSARGFNMLSEPARRKAMLRARDTGEPSLTNKVTLVQDKKVGNGQGFLLYVPYFQANTPTATEAQRQQNFLGVVYGGFRTQNFFQNVIETPSKQGNYSVKVYDETTSGSNLLYATTNAEDVARQKRTISQVRPISMFGVTWQLEFKFDQHRLVSKSERNAPTYILLVGVVIAFLVFLALLTIFKNRAAELQQQKDKEVNLAKDELLSLASHQMRTPATGVKQYLGMVLQGFTGKLSSQQKSLLDKAYKSNERQLYVINQILQLAKLESGRIVLAKHKTNLNDLITDIADEQHDEAASRGHRLKVQIPKKQVVLTVDSHMIRMAVENLLSNAIKYTIEPGEVRIKLSQTAMQAKIAIKDTGVGIEQKEFETIFKQFTRLYDEHTERISGTGVGLYLAEQLVKLHKGSLIVNSTIGKGSEFTIVLPKARNKKQ